MDGNIFFLRIDALVWADAKEYWNPSPNVADLGIMGVEGAEDGTGEYA